MRILPKAQHLRVLNFGKHLYQSQQFFEKTSWTAARYPKHQLMEINSIFPERRKKDRIHTLMRTLSWQFIEKIDRKRWKELTTKRCRPEHLFSDLTTCASNSVAIRNFEELRNKTLICVPEEEEQNIQKLEEGAGEVYKSTAGFN